MLQSRRIKELHHEMIGRAQQLARWLRLGNVPRVPILLYHRVAALETDPWLLAVTPAHFAAQMDVLQRHYQPLSLAQLVEAVHTGEPLPQRGVVVTFDDGYADNLHQAMPVLEQCGVPATLFLASGMLGSAREFWWDELDQLFLQPGTLPPVLEIRIDNRTHTWELEAAAHYRPADWQRYRRWRAWEQPPGPRQALYLALWQVLHSLSLHARSTVLNAVYAWAGAVPAHRATHRMLSLDETHALAHNTLVELGAHTVTHPSLAALPVAAQHEEIGASKQALEAIIKRPVTSFSYPYGKADDYTDDTINLVRHVGFTSACTNMTGVVTHASDPLQLPRLYVPDYDGPRFSRWLQRLVGT